MSATPGDFEKERSAQIVEQVIRPTGLLDPEITVKPTDGQIDDLISEINLRTAKGEPRAGDDADEEDGGGPDLLSGGRGHPGAVHAPRHRHGGAHGDHPRPAARRIRCARGHQPAARGARHPRGFAGGDSGRGQGRVPAIRALADPDDRPRGAQCGRPRHHVRGQRDPQHGGGHPRDGAPPHHPDAVQRGTPHHARRRL